MGWKKIGLMRRPAAGGEARSRASFFCAGKSLLSAFHYTENRGFPSRSSRWMQFCGFASEKENGGRNCKKNRKKLRMFFIE